MDSMDSMDDMIAIDDFIKSHSPSLRDKLSGLSFYDAVFEICKHYGIDAEKIKRIDSDCVDLSKLLATLLKKNTSESIQ